LAVIAGAAGALWHLKSSQRLGAPGVKVAPAQDGQGWQIALPVSVPGFVSSNLAPTSIELKMLPADTTFGRRHYAAPDGFQLMLNVVLMGTDRTSIHKPEFCLEAQGWRIIARQDDVLGLTQPRPCQLPVRRFIAAQTARLPGGRTVRANGVYVFWFVADQRVTASHFQRMAWITWDLLCSGVLPRWAYVSCFAVCQPGQEEATYQRMCDFLAASVPSFQLTFPPSAARVLQR
jgi:hypothetical protein